MPNFANSKFTEQELEDAMIELLEKEGYAHVQGESLHRRFDEVLLEDNINFYFKLFRY
jgi:type I restriction enzyme, R subunit